ncbi:biofilm regulation protein kinase SiaB [Oceanimonas sp. CHS3-5]|uniref:biofilm regulation protein kinase SiaB n=1 Tax=Oceanimonas sp. CHS3-5 TaxID=3068186 RepID=UPI00273ED756|nr:biofilm regulation protein kinase SiaB [Oceanimonas sp. CHS3-5]MDP5292586.1 biofilm regulation protein kinase SiaB [Oceanimonas sp. CHS3-5]
MQGIDLLSIREQFNHNRILLCFNGPISRSLIEEIGKALRNYLQADNAQPGAAMDVFGVYIELTQNIRHYATRMNYGELDGSATVVVARGEDGHYSVMAGNLVELEDGRALCARIEALAAMNKAELKAAYKTQLRQPRDEHGSSGAGLGLLDVARKSARPLTARLVEVGDGRGFLSILAVV